MRVPSMTSAIMAAVFVMAAVPAQVTLNVPSASYPTIQLAINLASPGAMVLVAPGTYVETLNFLGKAIIVVSAQGAAVTTLIGTPSNRVVTFNANEGPASILDGFTVRGGNGGILVQNASATIRNCVVRNNIATNNGGGGGIRVWATSNGTASPLISGCTILEHYTLETVFNGTGNGGGISCTADSGATSLLTVSACHIATNFAVGGPGGGILLNGSGSISPNLIGCTFSDNIASHGGGLNASVTALTMTSCRIVRNRAGNNGGIYLNCGTAALTNCEIVANSANENGAGTIGCGNATISHCTIAGNRVLGAAAAFGGLTIGSFSCTPQQTSITHSIIWGNDGIDLFRLVANCGGGSTVTPIISATWSDLGFAFLTFGATNMSVNPHFADPANGDFHLAASSPCRDAGDPAISSPPLTDLDGTARVVGAAIDIGSDEVPAAALPGTGEDLDLFSWVDGGGDPEASLITPAAGQIVRIGFASRGGAFAGVSALLLAQTFSAGSPPAPVSGHPAVHSDVASSYAVLLGSIPPVLFPAAGLPAAGVTFETQVPPGFAGTVARLQGFALTPPAANGIYAATAARDIVLP